MKKITLLIVVMLITLPYSFSQTIYVSPSGDDSNDGSSLNPVATFQKGADLAKAQEATTVQFADGEYIFDQTVVLDHTYDGISFRAAPGATPVFSSLVHVTGWTTFSGNIMQADLPEGLSHVRYLQDSSEDWLERSMLDYFSTTEDAGGNGGCLECNLGEIELMDDFSNIQYPNSFFTPDWSKASQYDLRHASLMWHQEVLPIATVDPSDRRIYTTIPSCYQMRANVQEVPPRTYVVNTLEGIDSPGEWACLDGKIYLYPKSGTNDIYAPTLKELIRLDDGTVDGNAEVTNPVQNITFDGITFTGGDFRALELGDVAVQHDWMVVDQPDALLRIRNAENITVTNCTFTKSGGTALRVDRYGQNISITNNTINYMGRNGIGLIGRGPGYGDVNKNNEIAYNHIERTGMEKWTAIAIVIDQSSNNHIHHNYIANTYFTAMAIIGPRQQAFDMNVEGFGDFYVGREWHFFEFAPNAIAAADPNSENGMSHVYNYNNVIEKNAFIDVGEGKGHFLNGKSAYLSGFKKNQTNSFNYNYIYDSFDHSADDYAWYNDMDQDACDVIGNMINGILSDGPLIVSFAGWAETDGEPTGSTILRANVSLNCTHCDNAECSHTLGNFTEEGAIKNGSGGSAAYVANYEESYTTICPCNIAGQDLPGCEDMKDLLAAKITEFGGTVPNESTPELDVFLWTSIGNGLTGYGLEIAVKNTGDAIAHNVTLTDLAINGMVIYNNRPTEWHRDVEPGTTLLEYPETLFLGVGSFKATMTVTCDEGINATGSGSGLIFGPLIFVP